MRRPAAVLGLVATALGGCLGGGEPGGTAGEGCLPLARSSGPGDGRPGVVALLADIDPRTGAMMGHASRLVRFSLPGGEVEAERHLGRGRSPAASDRVGVLRLDAPSGPRLAATRDGRTVLALVRDASGPDRVAVLDAQSLALRCARPLAPGVRHGGILLGRSRVYAFGVRRVGRGRWDAVLTVSGLGEGEPLDIWTLREARRGGGGRDWFVYWGALSEDERRLALSYHGSDTTGADWFRLPPWVGAASPARIRPRRLGSSPGGALTHGAITAVGRRFVAATGGDRLLELDPDGRLIGQLAVRARKTHLMDFAIGRERRLAYVSSCGRRPRIQRVSLAGRGPDGVSSGPDGVSSGPFCGKPLAVHADRHLLLDADRVGRLGYPKTRPDGLRLLDLRRPGGGHRLPLPQSAGPLDAVVVP